MKSEVTFWVLAGAFFCLGQKVWAQDAAGADQLLRDVSAISNEAGAIFSGDSDETALKWANLVGETDNGFSFRLEEMFVDWARSRPYKAIEAMEISALSGEQQLRVLESIQKRDRASNSGVESQRTIREILGESRSDPVTAMKAVETMEEGRGKDMMRRIVQYHLDQADLNRALTQAAGMQDGDAKDERFRSLAMALARSGEFSLALEAAEQLEDRWREGLLDQIFRRWLKSSSETALEALGKCSLSEEKKGFHRKAFSGN